MAEITKDCIKDYAQLTILYLYLFASTGMATIICFIYGPIFFPLALPSDFDLKNPLSKETKEKFLNWAKNFPIFPVPLYWCFVSSYYILLPLWVPVKYCPEDHRNTFKSVLVSIVFFIFLLISWPFLFLFDYYSPGLYQTTAENFWMYGIKITFP